MKNFLSFYLFVMLLPSITFCLSNCTMNRYGMGADSDATKLDYKEIPLSAVQKIKQGTEIYLRKNWMNNGYLESIRVYRFFPMKNMKRNARTINFNYLME